ncbi:MAG: NADH-quinone oxidoreductase subunit M [Alphaproteobacteria bacterium GM202ARS2]|nr:NADH-quinone oxidoreductase subunit M [Alphaproteobacteria bacterium GM202ARS2]
MTFVDFPILSALIFFPLVSAVLIMVTLGQPERVALNSRYLAFWGAGGHALLALALLFVFDAEKQGYQFVENVLWFAPFGIRYHLGVDGISLGLVLLTSGLTLAALMCSGGLTHRVKEYMAAFMVLECFVTGALLSLDLVPFYIFFEGVLLPMFFIIGVWGGKERVYASLKFFLYTLAGSLLMFVALVVLYHETGSTDIILIERAGVEPSLQMLLWLAFFASFAVKLPIWPFHSWLPLAHVEAPAAGSMMLAGILLKLGAYGFIRFSLPLFPDASVYFAPFMYALSVIAIIYASMVAWQQEDMKRLIAYSSVAHMGYVTLGIFSFTVQGLQGAMMQMISHGLLSAALFMGIGFLYHRVGSRDFAVYGGVARVLPLFSVAMMVYTLGSVALPGTSGFVGEFMVLHGLWTAQHSTWAVAAASGVVLSAVYMLVFYRRIFFGKQGDKVATLAPLTWTERSLLVIFATLVVLLGLMPMLYLDTLQGSSAQMAPLLDTLRAKAGGA